MDSAWRWWQFTQLTAKYYVDIDVFAQFTHRNLGEKQVFDHNEYSIIVHVLTTQDTTLGSPDRPIELKRSDLLFDCGMAYCSRTCSFHPIVAVPSSARVS